RPVGEDRVVRRRERASRWKAESSLHDENVADALLAAVPNTPAARAPRPSSLLSFPDVNVSVDRLEPKLRPAAIDRTETRFLNHYPEFAATLATVLHLSGLFHKYAYVRCPQFGPWRGAREGVYPQRYPTDRATKPRAKLGATRRAACLLDGGVVARSLQIHCGICSSLAPGLRPQSIAPNVYVFMRG